MSGFAIRYPFFIIMLCLIIMVVGVSGARHLGLLHIERDIHSRTYEPAISRRDF